MTAFLHIVVIGLCVFVLLCAMIAWFLVRFFRYVASVVEKMPKKFLLRVTCLSSQRSAQIFLNGAPRATIAVPTTPADASLVDLATQIDPQDYSTGVVTVRVAGVAPPQAPRTEGLLDVPN